MKNLKSLVLLFLVATVSLVSCNKDDDDATPAAAALEGKWQYSKDGTVVNGQEVLVDYNHEPGCTKDYFEFLNGSVCKDHYFDSDFDCEETIEAGAWSRNNSTITYTFSGESYTEEILELTATTLKIKAVNSGVTYITVFTRI